MKHQTQPTHDSCVVTCCAMLASKPAKMAYEHFHEKLWDRTVNTEWILQSLGIESRRTFYEGGHVFKGHVYLAAVPSLNEPGLMHQIILDCRHEPLIVLDPAQGLPDRKYYAWEPEKGVDPLAVPLISWLNEFEVIPHDQRDDD